MSKEIPDFLGQNREIDVDDLLNPTKATRDRYAKIVHYFLGSNLIEENDPHPAPGQSFDQWKLGVNRKRLMEEKPERIPPFAEMGITKVCIEILKQLKRNGVSVGLMKKPRLQEIKNGDITGWLERVGLQDKVKLEDISS